MIAKGVLFVIAKKEADRCGDPGRASDKTKAYRGARGRSNRPEFGFEHSRLKFSFIFYSVLMVM